MRAVHKPYSLQERSNFHHLVLDIAWFGLAWPAVSRFLSVYAIRLGAGANELSLMTSLPAVVLLFSATLAGWWMRRYQDTMRALFWPTFGFRLQFLLPAFTPFLPADWQPTWLILSLVLPALPQGISSVAFLIMLREAVDETHIPPLISRRLLVFNLAFGLSGLALGVWLEKAPFPLNYQAMYLLAFGLALVSMWEVMKVRLLPPAQPAAPTVRVNPWRVPAFWPVVVITGVTHLAFFSVMPLIPLHLVNNLNAGEGYMALFGLAELVAGAAITLAVSRLIVIFGNRTLIALSMFGLSLSAAIAALAPSLNVALLSAVLMGASWAVTGVALFAYFSESTPAAHKSSYTTAYTQVIFLATFVGPMIGSGLYDRGANLVVILLIGSGIRMLAGMLVQAIGVQRLRWVRDHIPLAR